MACKYETSNGRCGLKGCYAYRHKCYTEDMCKCHEPQTNADRIRDMSDEDLAVFVRSIIIAEDCPAPGCDCDKCFFKEPCFNGSKWHGKEIEWLKQPAE